MTESVGSESPAEQLLAMQDREKRIMELLNCQRADRIEHDLRNVLNELNLLRMIFKKMDTKEGS